MQAQRFEAWMAVILLCLMLIFSFVDRLILGLLAVDVGRDLHLGDAQLGLLIGTSFAIVYTLSGVPIANYLDRGNRKWAIVAGVAFWGGATVASGFADSFATLATCRVGVALGEAVLTPAAVSLIGDLFPRERRLVPTAAYAAMGALGGGAGLLAGASALELARDFSAIAGLAPWRLALVFAGIPPLLLALLFAVLVREPERGGFDATERAAPHLDFRSFLARFSSAWTFYLPLYAGTALFTIYLFGMMTWLPALMVRGHGWDVVQTGYIFGMVSAGAGLAGAIGWPRLAVVLERRGVRDPLLAALAVAACTAVPFMIIGPSLPTGGLAVAACGLAVLAATGLPSLLPIVVQSYGPGRMRARLMALLSIAQSLIGYGAGPGIAAAMASAWPDEPRALAFSLSLIALAVAPLGAFAYLRARHAAARLGLSTGQA